MHPHYSCLDMLSGAVSGSTDYSALCHIDFVTVLTPTAFTVTYRSRPAVLPPVFGQRTLLQRNDGTALLCNAFAQSSTGKSEAGSEPCRHAKEFVSLPVGLRFLDGLAPLEVDEVVAVAASKRFPANSAVINQGRPANRLFLLTKGRARYFFITENGQRLLLHWIMPGEIFGAAALLAKRGSYIFGAEMVEEGAVLVWDRDSIRRHFAKYPRLLDNTLPIFADYLTRHAAMQAVLAHRRGRQRLAQVLVTFARAIGHATQDGIELHVTNEELATASNVTVFTASRLLNQWQREGVLVKRRGEVLLRFPERLLPVEVWPSRAN